MRISARTQYALRAAVALAAAADKPMHAEEIAADQDIPRRFCDNILLQLRRAGLIRSQRGPEGGYWLARPAAEITLADIVEVTEGVPEEIGQFPGVAGPLADVWAMMREHEHALLSEVTLAHIVASARSDPS
ncbi:Rrf2 family transcriptional regulator [Planomonospora sp. ID67723]|uniref:RrF2 family transcriptional regulator n=1 Tax=Planomonospora sp. ID67723 TaxID=2738134 RepID=UPI0018C43239|nr:Rrf2 family transcriptional regulator [Planomonospora sp. ID67723]MBG0830051.1 Rrf2 family transcriptional regulator [Planomonospora sp. ID67723]